MLYHQPLVSICIPTYNAERTVMSTLQSILNQTYHNLELLIVDNASTDNTLTVLRKLNEPRMKIHKNEENIGLFKNLDRCIEVGSQKYLHKVNGLSPENIAETVLHSLSNNPNALGRL